MLTVVQQEVVGLRPFRQGLGWLRDLHYRGSSDVVHLHYSLSVQYPNCFPLPASRRDRHGAVGREPSNSTGGTFTRVARHCAGCCAGTMQWKVGQASCLSRTAWRWAMGVDMPKAERAGRAASRAPDEWFKAPTDSEQPPMDFLIGGCPESVGKSPLATPSSGRSNVRPSKRFEIQ